jgi:hypothetical protein
MYRLVLDDSYQSKELGRANNKEELIQQAVAILTDSHIPSNQLNIWQEDAGRTIVDYGSWTHFFYIDEEKGATDV